MEDTEPELEPGKNIFWLVSFLTIILSFLLFTLVTRIFHLRFYVVVPFMIAFPFWFSRWMHRHISHDHDPADWWKRAASLEKNNGFGMTHPAASAERNFSRLSRLDIWFLVGIGILLVALTAPEVFQFRAHTRVLATKENLELIRDKIHLFKRHHGRFPRSLEELLTETYQAKGRVTRRYLEEMPPEVISTERGFKDFVDVLDGRTQTEPGGWAYEVDAGQVQVNINTELDRRWGKFRGEVPSKW